MKKLILIFLLLPALAFANDISTIAGKAISAVSTIAGKAKADIATVDGGGVPAAGVTTECVGYSTDCNESGDPGTNITLNADYTIIYRWTATKNGTATRIKFRFGTDGTSARPYAVVLYRGNTLIGQASITGANASWVWSSSLVAEAGQSLDFSTDDQLNFGFSFDQDGTDYIDISRNNAAGNYYYYQTAYLPASATFTNVASKTLGAILEYTTP